AKGVEGPPGPLASLDGEIGTRGVADEERVAGEHEPRLVAARAVDHGKAAMLRTVTGRVDRAQAYRADLDDRAIVEWLERELRVCGGMDVHRARVVDRKPPVAGEMIGVRVRLEHVRDPHTTMV